MRVVQVEFCHGQRSMDQRPKDYSKIIEKFHLWFWLTKQEGNSPLRYFLEFPFIPLTAQNCLFLSLSAPIISFPAHWPDVSCPHPSAFPILSFSSPISKPCQKIMWLAAWCRSHITLAINPPPAGTPVDSCGRGQDRHTARVVSEFGDGFSLMRDGWRQFCEEMNVDPDVLFADLPGNTLIENFATMVPHLPSADELTQRMDPTPPNATLPTADEAHADYRQLFLQISEPWMWTTGSGSVWNHSGVADQKLWSHSHFHSYSVSRRSSYGSAWPIWNVGFDVAFNCPVLLVIVLPHSGHTAFFSGMVHSLLGVISSPHRTGLPASTAA